jgi:hypothetical protein
MVLPFSALVSDEDDTGQHAADEPTAMWDEEALAKLGLATSSAPKAAPAKGPGLAVSVETATPAATASGGAKPKSPVLGWVVTLALALALGVAVYFVVRALR